MHFYKGNSGKKEKYCSEALLRIFNLNPQNPTRYWTEDIPFVYSNKF